MFIGCAIIQKWTLVIVNHVGFSVNAAKQRTGVMEISVTGKISQQKNGTRKTRNSHLQACLT